MGNQAKVYQLDFLKDKDICRKRHKGNKFSDAAHKSIRFAKNSIRQLVLDQIKASGAEGLTCEEVEKATSLSHQTVSARCAELKALNLIFIIGGRETKSGRRAAVYVAFEVRPEEKI